MFTTIGAFSNEKEFITDDAVGATKWIEGEVEAFDEVLTGCGDFCACSVLRGSKNSFAT